MQYRNKDPPHHLPCTWRFRRCYRGQRMVFMGKVCCSSIVRIHNRIIRGEGGAGGTRVQALLCTALHQRPRTVCFSLSGESVLTQVQSFCLGKLIRNLCLRFILRAGHVGMLYLALTKIPDSQRVTAIRESFISLLDTDCQPSSHMPATGQPCMWPL